MKLLYFLLFFLICSAEATGPCQKAFSYGDEKSPAKLKKNTQQTSLSKQANSQNTNSFKEENQLMRNYLKETKLTKGQFLKKDTEEIALLKEYLEIARSEAGFFLQKKYVNKDSLTGRELLIVKLIGSNLNGAKLLVAYLLGISFKNASLPRAILKTPYLEGINLQGIKSLIDSDLKGAIFWHANLSQVPMKLSHLEGSDFTGAKLDKTNLQYAILDGSIMKINSFSGDFRGASLVQVTMEGSNTRYIKLQTADLLQANLRLAQLKNARLEGADLSGSTIENTNFYKARYDKHTTFPEDNKTPLVGLIFVK